MEGSKLYTLLPNLLTEIPEIPQDGILSRTVFKSPSLKAVLFAFDAGQELSKHTSTHAAILQIIQGEASITLGEDAYQAQAHTWIHMPPHLPHSVFAHTQTIMLLLMEGD